MERSINGKTKVLAVIGDPIEHSLSPEIHNTLCRKLNLNYAYVPFRVDPVYLQDAVKGFRAAEIAGFNITIPHKQNIIDFIDEVSYEAQLMGAVNTVKIDEGKLIGYNTDGVGFIRSLQNNNVEVKGKNIVILGAGGSSRGIAVKMAMEGANHITILNRSIEKAQEISNIININISNIAKANILNQEILSLSSESCDILINTTPIGMYPKQDACPVNNIDFLSETTVVCDLIYNPQKTVFLEKAEEKGHKIINGWGMLVNQAVAAFEIWTGVNVGHDLIEYFL